MNILKVLFYLFLITAINSCGDDDTGGSEGLSIVINSPDDNSTFNIGETITIAFTVTDDESITSIAYNTRSQFGTGSIPASEFTDDITEFSGEFNIVANASAPGTYPIDLSATDSGFTNVVEATITVILE